ncbi:DNA polymerase II [Shewanella zhangzhouensis]|nr:DNA polymerase II [Shewanella zhangzhouensis]
MELSSVCSPGSNDSMAPTLLKGRVLTRASVQRGGDTVLEYLIKTAHGPVKVEVHNQRPMAFCHSDEVQRLLAGIANTEAWSTPLKLQSFSRQPVHAIYCRTGVILKRLVTRALELDIALYEADIKPEQRFLIERFVALDAEFYGYFDGSDPARFIATRVRATSEHIPLKAVSLDIECSMSGELYSIGLYGDCAAKVIMVGEGDTELICHRDGIEHRVAVEWACDEVGLLMSLQRWFMEVDPDILLGWAVVTFDLSLLWRRAKHHGMRLCIGRFGKPLGWKVEDKHRPETLDLPGRVVLDGIDWLKAAFYQFDSFALDRVAGELLGEGKAIHNPDDRGEEITRLFSEDKAALAFYNLTDCRLVWDIFQKTDLIHFALERARLTGLEFGRVGASVAAFNHLYLPHLHRAGFVAPAMQKVPGPDSPGGYVMDSVPGLYRNVLVLDYKSLYPSIIRTFLIDPKGLVLGLSEPEAMSVEGFRGARFSRQSPILPGLVATLASRREEAKANHNGPMSQAVKIIMNSLYGVLGSRGCVFHDYRLASSITLRGHEIMRTTKAWIEAEGFQVIYGDTDSTFVWLGDDAKDANTTGRALVDMVNQRWRQQLREDKGLECFLELEFERHFEQFFMPTLRHSTEGSKKRYVGQCDNGNDKVLVFKGMEQVRSDWSPLARRVQYELYRRLFQQEDLIEYVQEVERALFAGEYDDELVFHKRLKRDINQYTAKSAPHVKAAALLVSATGDANRGKRGAAIKYIFTKAGAEPLGFQSHPIDYDYYFDRQLLPILEPILAVLKVNYQKAGAEQLLLI